MDLLLELIKLFFWLFFLVLISFFLGFLSEKIFTGKKYQIILFPGVIVHELSHIIGCLITGSSIKEVKMFSPKGSYVSHTKPKLPLIGNFIVSFAPIIGGILVIMLIAVVFNYNFPLVSLSVDSFIDSFVSIIGQSVNFIINYYNTWQFWLFSYIVLSVIICLVPSKQDLKNSFISLIFVLVVVLILCYFQIFNEPIIEFLNNNLISVLGISLFFGLTITMLTLFIFIIKKIIF